MLQQRIIDKVWVDSDIPEEVINRVLKGIQRLCLKNAVIQKSDEFIEFRVSEISGRLDPDCMLKCGTRDAENTTK